MRILIDDRDRFLDNVFIEQLWRSLKEVLIARAHPGIADDAPLGTVSSHLLLDCP